MNSDIAKPKARDSLSTDWIRVCLSQPQRNEVSPKRPNLFLAIVADPKMYPSPQHVIHMSPRNCPSAAAVVAGAASLGTVTHQARFRHSAPEVVIMWFDAKAHNVWRSPDHGQTWEKVSTVPGEIAMRLEEHPFDAKIAYILTDSTTHYKTVDQGATWQSFNTPLPATETSVFSFHSERSNYVLYTGRKCEKSGERESDCHDETYYTIDNFETNPKLLLKYTVSCAWTRSTKEFQAVANRDIMCLEWPNKNSESNRDLDSLRLVQSEDFFQSSQPVRFGFNVTGIVRFGAIDKFLVAAAKDPGNSDSMTLYVSEDSKTWSRAVFPTNSVSVREKAYTILESSHYALFVDVLTNPEAPFGTLYISNSKGIYFTRSLNNTNRNEYGIVDFEKIQGVEGIMIANIVDNPEDVLRSDEKRILTRMSFDDGSKWSSIKNVVKNDGAPYLCKGQGEECTLHLHSVTSPHNEGNVFTANAAVGLIMGVGNVGRSLLKYDSCDTFLSTDGGLNWKMVMEGAHKYEFGDTGSVIVLVDDEKPTDRVFYSKDQGKTWQSFNLGVTMQSRILTSDPESTTTKFLLVGTTDSGQVQAIQLDFSNLFPRQCVLDQSDTSKQDFERWYARDLTPSADCLMGHEQAFWRRKPDADCYVGRKYKYPVVETKNCQCTVQDFECDFNFIENEQGECVRSGPLVIPAGQCVNGATTFAGSSGYRKIPGDTCEGGLERDNPVNQSCSLPLGSLMQDPTVPDDQNIEHYEKYFDSQIQQFMYFKESSTILIRTQTGEMYRSGDEGVKWDRVLEDKSPIIGYWMHEHDNKRAYLFTRDLFFATVDQGVTWEEIKLPSSMPPGSLPLDSHPTEFDWLIFMGQVGSYQNEAFVSLDHGKNWKSIATWVTKCIFGRDSKFDDVEKESIFCTGFKYPNAEQSDNPIQLFKTNTQGTTKEVYFNNVVQFFVVEDFMAVATEVNGALMLYVSVDGKTFAEAQFPPTAQIDRNTFTILQSTTGSVFLNVERKMPYGNEYGTLFKSNENGTFYHQTLDNTNNDASGLVDFEKMQWIDGIILANQVSNTGELNGGGDVAKKIRTMISWDDGGKWERLKAPAGACDTSADCGLNLHSRTKIHGPGAIFTASGAPGLAVGVGNTGSYLLPYEQGQTFLTRDAGHTWTQIRAGEHLYEFGDHGSLMVLVNDEGPTNELVYSLDPGNTPWRTYNFAKDKVRVSTLTTEPRSTSLKFILIGHTMNSDTKPSQQVLITIDLTPLGYRTCDFSETDQDKNDFEKWTPKDDDGDDACLLGRRMTYWRRKKDRVCFIGSAERKVEQENCPCRDIDFECDFGFWRNENGDCVLHGRHPDRPEICNKDQTFNGRSGYKKISRSTCNGGVNLAKQIDWNCDEALGIESKKMVFSEEIREYIYFDGTDSVILHTADGKVWQSDDDGYSWRNLFSDTQILAVIQNPQANERAYFITNATKHYVTTDRGRTTSTFETKLPPMYNLNGGGILRFHSEEKDWLIYGGEDKCDSLFSPDCHGEAFYSKDNGGSWNSLGTYVHACHWGRDGRFKSSDKELVFCEQYYEKAGDQRLFYSTNPLQYLSSNNYLETKKSLFDSIVGVALFEQYMIVAELVENDSKLRLSISLDGDTFAEAQFPPNRNLKKEAYTIMESVTSSVWLHVSTNTKSKQEYGVIFTSNSNGTYFGVSLEDVNRNSDGIVDFEKMQGIEGIALANQVTNPQEVNMGNSKKLRTMITLDDGRSWKTLTKPELGPDGKKYDCSDCTLNLHSYSERRNPRDLFSHSSAVGLMVAVGNVGPSLTAYTDGDTFLTRDAGKTWFAVHDQAHLWEFGDQGALLIIVDDEEPTDHLMYTTDEGKSWKQYTFVKAGDNKVRVSDIITQPDGTSQKFVLLGRERLSGKQVGYHIDFSGLRLEKCTY
ncbi:hypothetical protein BC936DRAFT_148495, partial [Jimgerdemannia flammicorona]